VGERSLVGTDRKGRNAFKAASSVFDPLLVAEIALKLELASALTP